MFERTSRSKVDVGVVVIVASDGIVDCIIVKLYQVAGKLGGR